MRILMLTCHPGIQGPFPKILPLLASALRSQDCLVAEEPWGRHRDDEKFFDKILGRPGDILRVRRRLRREKFDVMVIHTTTEWPNYSRDLPVMRLCRHLVPRIVLQFHGSYPGLVLGAGHQAFKAASRAVLRLADATLVLSSEELRDWQRFHPQGRFHTAVNPFVSRQGLRPPNGPVPWKVPPNIPILLYVGRLLETKGILDLADALALLADRTPFHLLMAGVGPAEQAFRDRIQRHKLEDRVTLAGYLTGDKLWQAYEAADVFVFPSWSEGFPTVITEAMDAGLPLVATHIRGAVDHLREGLHGRFVPPREPRRFAEALAGVLSDRALRESMSRANQAKVREFAPDVVAAHYLSLLKRIAGSSEAHGESEDCAVDQCCNK